MSYRVSPRYPRRFFSALWIMALVLIVVFQGRPAEAQATDTITVAPSVNPTSGEFASVEFTVALALTGNSSLCQTTIVSRPADILLIIGHSDSMYRPAGGG